MVTTIQLSERIKSVLESMKKGNETYEDVISRLISQGNNKNQLLKQGYIEMNSKEINKEWEKADLEWK